MEQKAKQQHVKQLVLQVCWGPAVGADADSADDCLVLVDVAFHSMLQAALSPQPGAEHMDLTHVVPVQGVPDLSPERWRYSCRHSGPSQGLGLPGLKETALWVACRMQGHVISPIKHTHDVT